MMIALLFVLVTQDPPDLGSAEDMINAGRPWATGGISDECLASVATWEITEENLGATRQLATQIAGGVRLMDLRYRDAVHMYFEIMREAETAKRMGLPPAEFDAQIANARMKLEMVRGLSDENRAQHPVCDFLRGTD